MKKITNSNTIEQLLRGKYLFVKRILFKILRWLIEPLVLNQEVQTQELKEYKEKIQKEEGLLQQIQKDIIQMKQESEKIRNEINFNLIEMKTILQKHTESIQNNKNLLLQQELNIVELEKKKETIEYCTEELKNQSFQIEQLKANSNTIEYCTEELKNQSFQIEQLKANSNTIEYCTEELKNQSFQIEQLKINSNTIRYCCDKLKELNFETEMIKESSKMNKIENDKLKIRFHKLNQKADKREQSIIQFVPVYSSGDAISNLAFTIDRLLKKAGIISHIYAFEINCMDKEHEIHLYKDIPALFENDILILHMAAENYMSDILEAYDCYKILYYHNITPPEFFHGYDDFAEKSTKNALKQMEKMKEVINYCITDSNYNKEQLLLMNYPCPIDVVPVLLDKSQFEEDINKEIINKYNHNKKNIIFVGRIVPNKKIDDIIKCFSAYKKDINPNARLILIGKYSPESKYYLELVSLIEELEVEDVIFTGYVIQKDLVSYYQCADLFLCLSEHEGYCVPLIEAMYYGIPIIAYKAGAVEETLGEAGILLENKNISEVIKKMDDVLNKRYDRNKMLQEMKNKVKYLTNGEVDKNLLNIIKEIWERRNDRNRQSDY